MAVIFERAGDTATHHRAHRFDCRGLVCAPTTGIDGRERYKDGSFGATSKGIAGRLLAFGKVRMSRPFRGARKIG